MSNRILFQLVPFSEKYAYLKPFCLLLSDETLSLPCFSETIVLFSAIKEPFITLDDPFWRC